MDCNKNFYRGRISYKTPKKAYFGGVLVELRSTEKLLEIQIDSDLTFDEPISSICDKVGKKVNVLNRLVNYMSLDKCCMVMKTFIESQFHYCPLIWTFHSRTLNNKINRLHERALRIVHSLNYCELLEKHKSFSIHHKRLSHGNLHIFYIIYHLVL